MRSLHKLAIGCFVFILAGIAGCSPNNVTVDDGLAKHFKAKGVEGCFALYDNSKNEFSIYNLERYRDSAFTPASTFKIINALIALKTGKVFDEKDLIPWDGKIRSNSQWNQDLTLEQAFKLSSPSHYQQIARRIGIDTMQIWLDSVKYGNRKISTVDSFWLDNSLKITADEQLGLAKQLYFEQLPMDKRPQRIVRQMMLQEDNANFRLSYKTGLAYKENGKALGWIVGWIEENKRPYFFVLNMEGDSGTNIITARLEILTTILTQYGFFKGNK